MGFNFGWVAVRGRAPQDVLVGLGLHPTGEMLEFREDGAAGLLMPSGWYVVECPRWEHLDDDDAAELSKGCEVISGVVFEGPMTFASAMFVDGREIWSVLHDSEEGDDHLEASGALPEAFEALKARALKAQAESEDVDHLAEVPVELAAGITGYTYGEVYEELGDEPWDELVPVGELAAHDAAAGLEKAMARWRARSG